jgi:hypothetical protein
MTPQEVNSMVESVGIPSAYYQFADDTGQQPPFICFFYGNSNDVTADNINYVRVERLYIELYTDQKDFALESKVEKALNDNGIVFAKSQDYIDTERMHVTVYESDIVLEV